MIFTCPIFRSSSTRCRCVTVALFFAKTTALLPSSVLTTSFRSFRRRATFALHSARLRFGSRVPDPGCTRPQAAFRCPRKDGGSSAHRAIRSTGSARGTALKSATVAASLYRGASGSSGAPAAPSGAALTGASGSALTGASASASAAASAGAAAACSVFSGTMISITCAATTGWRQQGHGCSLWKMAMKASASASRSAFSMTASPRSQVSRQSRQKAWPQGVITGVDSGSRHTGQLVASVSPFSSAISVDMPLDSTLRSSSPLRFANRSFCSSGRSAASSSSAAARSRRASAASSSSRSMRSPQSSVRRSPFSPEIHAAAYISTAGLMTPTMAAAAADSSPPDESTRRASP